MQFSELAKRLVVAFVGIPVIFALIYFGQMYFFAFSAFVVLMALWEYYGLAEKKGQHPNKPLGLIGGMLLGIILYWQLPVTIFLITLVIATVLVELFREKTQPMLNMAVTVGGIFYIGLFYAMMLIRQLPAMRGMDSKTGAWLIYMIFIAIWACDTAAYGFGSWLGKHKLFPRISPNKTWEGAIAGLLTGIATTVSIQILFIPQLRLLDAFIIGIIVGVGGQLGDLVESMFKRDAGVKDSSALLPGHGGVLDRFDSPMIAAPLVYLYLLQYL